MQVMAFSSDEVDLFQGYVPWFRSGEVVMQLAIDVIHTSSFIDYR